MTPAQEDFALRSCHPLYAEWCREDEDKDVEPDFEDEPDYEEDYPEED